MRDHSLEGQFIYPTRNFAPPVDAHSLCIPGVLLLVDQFECTTSRLADRSFLSISPCRHRVRTISSSRSLEMAGVWSLRIPSKRFPAGFPAWSLSNHTPIGLLLPLIATSTDWIHRVFLHTASCTHQRHRWEGQHPLPAKGFPTLGMSVTSTHN